MRRWAIGVLLIAVLGATTAPLWAGSGRVRTVFTVEGMHCDSCSAAITGALQRIEGVQEASADHEGGQAVAVYLARKVSADDLKAAIEKLGYTVTAMETTSVPE